MKYAAFMTMGRGSAMVASLGCIEYDPVDFWI